MSWMADRVRHPLAVAVNVEARKLVDTRSARWLLVVMLLAGLMLIGLVVGVAYERGAALGIGHHRGPRHPGSFGLSSSGYPVDYSRLAAQRRRQVLCASTSPFGHSGRKVCGGYRVFNSGSWNRVPLRAPGCSRPRLGRQRSGRLRFVRFEPVAGRLRRACRISVGRRRCFCGSVHASGHRVRVGAIHSSGPSDRPRTKCSRGLPAVGNLLELLG